MTRLGVKGKSEKEAARLDSGRLWLKVPRMSSLRLREPIG